MLQNWTNALTILEGTLLIIILLSCVTGNIMMLLVIAKYQGPRYRTYTLLGNLAIADLGLGIFSMPFTIVTLIAKKWLLGSFLCSINGFMNAFWIPATVFATTNIIIYKCYSLYDPFNQRTVWIRLRVLIVVTWALSLLSAVGPIVGWHKFDYNPDSTQCGLGKLDSALDYSYIVFLVITVYSLPMILNVLSFLLLFRAIHKHIIRMGEHAIFTQSRMTSQKRSIVTFLIIFISYVISWTPFFVYGLLKVAGAKMDLAGQYLTVAYMLGYSNTVHNPIIFAFRNKEFRESFKEIMMSICSRYKGKFSKMTNTTLISSLSLQFFQRSESELTSAWYINRDELFGDSVLCFDRQKSTNDEDIILQAMGSNAQQQETSNISVA